DHLELHPGVRLIVAPVVEGDAGVEDHVLDPLATQLIEQTRETSRGALRLVLPDLHRADVMRVCAFDVDRHGGDTGVGDDTTHLRVGEATGVVDDHGTRADGGSGHLRLPGVDGNEMTLGDQGFHGRNRPGDLVVGRNGGVLVVGGLPADI